MAEVPQTTSNDPTKIILVTGGSGLIGKAVEHVIRNGEGRDDEKWVFVTRKDADFTEWEEVNDLFERVKPTHVVHLAAICGGLFTNIKYNLDFLRNNMAINDHALRASTKHEVIKVVSCLSASMLPAKTIYPVDESMLHNGPGHPTDIGYSTAKRVLDLQNRVYSQKYSCKFTSVLPANVFGPHGNFNIEEGSMIHALIHKVYLAKSEGKEFAVWGTGSSRRQFTHSQDVARLLVWALREYEDTEPVIVSVGEDEEVSVKEAVEMIAKAMNYKGELKYDTTKPDGQFRKTVSNAKLKKLLPDFKFTPMKQAIQETCDWLVQNYDSARK